MHKTWQISDCWNLLLLCRITRWCRCQRLRSNISCMSNALSVVYINTVYIYMHVCIKTQTWSKSISDMYLISFYMYMSLCLVNLLKLQYLPYLLSRPTIYTTLFLGRGHSPQLPFALPTHWLPSPRFQIGINTSHFILVFTKLLGLAGPTPTTVNDGHDFNQNIEVEEPGAT